jgi:predicted ATPase with chaperone activity
MGTWPEGEYRQHDRYRGKRKKYGGINTQDSLWASSAAKGWEGGISDVTARVHDKICRIARPIADLAGLENIPAEHVAEAISYRKLDRKL